MWQKNTERALHCLPIMLSLPAITLFSLGLSYFLSALYVFFRDLKHIYTVVLTLWTYLTPLFYAPEALNNPALIAVLKFNPMYYYVTYFRDLLMGVIPTLGEHILCYAFGIGAFAIGALFMLAVDTAARTIAGNEIPVSILTALIGAPFFIYLLRRTGGAR